MDLASVNLLEAFEGPPPILKCKPEKIETEAEVAGEGTFRLINAGGGELKGFITSNSQAVKFFPSEFSGGKTDVTFKIDARAYKAGETIRTSAVITSNGGEIILPFVVKVIPSAITAKDGTRLTALEDFKRLNETKPEDARALFTHSDFTVWLMNMNYEYMELYDLFAQDANKERAVDNFLIISGLKEKARVSAPVPRVSIVVPQRENSEGTIVFKREGEGRLDCALSVDPPYSWIALDKTRITSSDFGESGECPVGFSVMPVKFPNNLRHESVRVIAQSDAGDAHVNLTGVREPLFSAKLKKEGFGYDDAGTILFRNNKGTEITVNVKTDCPYIKFKNYEYKIKANTAEIKFAVKVGAFAAAQLLLRGENQTRDFITLDVDRSGWIGGKNPSGTINLPFVISRNIGE